MFTCCSVTVNPAMDNEREDGAAPKRLKMETKEEAAGETLSSEFSAVELWQRLPCSLLEDVFAYLSLHTGSRLCRLECSFRDIQDCSYYLTRVPSAFVNRNLFLYSLFGVSSAWKHILSRLGLFNKGIVFFQWCWTEVLRYSRWTELELELRRMIWIGQPLQKVYTIKQFVIAEKLNHVPLRNYAPLLKKLSTLPHSLTTVPLCGYIGWHGLSAHCFEHFYEFLLENSGLQVVRFINCEFRPFLQDFVYSLDSEKPEVKEYFRWCVHMPRTLRVLDAETVRQMGKLDPPKYSILLLPQSPAEWASVFWPYPEEQLEWLASSLNNLESLVQPATFDLIAHIYRKYCTENR